LEVRRTAAETPNVSPFYYAIPGLRVTTIRHDHAEEIHPKPETFELEIFGSVTGARTRTLRLDRA
jgi:hypothetical protein